MYLGASRPSPYARGTNPPHAFWHIARQSLTMGSVSRTSETEAKMQAPAAAAGDGARGNAMPVLVSTPSTVNRSTRQGCV